MGIVKINTHGAAHGAPGQAECDSTSVMGIFLGPTYSPWKLLNHWTRCKKVMDDIARGVNVQGISSIPSSTFVKRLRREFTPPLEVVRIFIRSGRVREGNVCVDRLANFGVSSKTYTWDDIPNFIYHVFARNKLALPSYRFSRRQIHMHEEMVYRESFAWHVDKSMVMLMKKRVKNLHDQAVKKEESVAWNNQGTLKKVIHLEGLHDHHGSIHRSHKA
ncbi:hypothetical protein Lal_00027220, partial [Lupinus albus]